MLRIYSVILEVLRGLRPVVAAIVVHDRDLARQLRRAATSVALNTGRGERLAWRHAAGALSHRARVGAGDGRVSRCGHRARRTWSASMMRCSISSITFGAVLVKNAL